MSDENDTPVVVAPHHGNQRHDQKTDTPVVAAALQLEDGGTLCLQCGTPVVKHTH